MGLIKPPEVPIEKDEFRNKIIRIIEDPFTSIKLRDKLVFQLNAYDVAMGYKYFKEERK